VLLLVLQTSWYCEVLESENNYPSLLIHLICLSEHCDVTTIKYYNPITSEEDIRHWYITIVALYP
jgi:hypothetical protein